MSKTFNKLDIYSFGRQLLETGDLDPVYVMVWEAELEPDILHRWLLAYWCFYHAGTSSWITQPRLTTGDDFHPKGFWYRMSEAAGSSDYPRGTERRHFRADNALNSLAYLMAQGIPSLFFWVGARKPIPLSKFMGDVQQWVGFGTWIAFKVADMVERLGLAQIEFNDAAMFLFKSPREGAELLWQEENGTVPPVDVNTWAVGRIITELRGYLAPPRQDRPINSQEAETILCKWKSHRNGHYQVGKDVHELRNALARFGGCSLSQRLNKAGRKGGLW